MIVDKSVKFKLTLGNQLAFKYFDENILKKQGVNEQPYVIRPIEQEQIADISNKGIFNNLKAFLKADDKQRFAKTYYHMLKKGS